MSENNKRLAKNTLLLYVRTFFIMVVALYTSRVILEAIGIEDYGIYSVVGGLVVSFSILTRALSGAGSRFITFHLGKGEATNIKRAFSTSFQIQVLISIIVILILEIFGVWFLNNKMNIPYSRVYAANWVLQCSIFTFVIGLLRVPYEASIIAYEKMGFYAKIGVVEVVLQLLIVFALLHCNSDRLILYSILMFILTLFVMLVSVIYCHILFKDCRVTKKIEKRLFKEMLSFAGWNFIGTSAGILKNQGVDVIINIFFGVSINAGRGIATQVNSAVTRFSQNFMTAINPQITKSYASGEESRLRFLILEGARYSYFLILVIAVPLIIEMPAILKIWLNKVPPDACIFTRLQLICSMISVLSTTNTMAMLATGDIRRYQIIVGGVALFNFPLSLLLLYIGLPAYITYISAIFVEFCCLYARFSISKQLLSIGISDFIKHVAIKIINVTLVAIIVPSIVVLNVDDDSIFNFILITLTSISWSGLCIYFIGLNEKEREFICLKVNKILKLKKNV